MFDSRKGSIKLSNCEELFLEHRLKSFFEILLIHKDDVVTRDEIMTHVWQDIIVNDTSITKAVSDLRKFFTMNKIKNVKIRTIRKIGYQLEIEHAAERLIKNNKLLRFSKITGYAMLILLALIILIRAARY